jgi:alkaline phosphatase D
MTLTYVKYALLVGLAVVAACQSASRPGLPPGSPFADSVLGDDPLPHGVASGDVRSRSAIVWFRTTGPAKAQVEWKAEGDQAVRSRLVQPSFQTDFTAHLLADGLKPGSRYRYAVLTGKPDDPDHALRASNGAEGQFTTPPADDQARPVTFVWSGDVGGQQQCRRPPDGYKIFERLLQVQPDFAVMLGDTIYADEACSAPPNVPGSEFTAGTLDEYRRKHRYQREDPALKRFLASVPVYAVWDDHEVRNNFSGPTEPLMPMGHQAFTEYWPIARSADDPARLYRNFQWGSDVEMFLLDTRQYRSSNAHKDGPNKTMLGDSQRAWLLDALSRSKAIWKFIVTSVPLSNPKGGTLLIPGNDSWARGSDGTGFLTELRAITGAIRTRGIRNVVWLAGDVHYPEVHAYDADADGVVDFYEFISGPLSAHAGTPVAPNQDLHPTTLYSAGGFANFGVIRVAGASLRLAIVDDAGQERFSKIFEADTRQAGSLENTPVRPVP